MGGSRAAAGGGEALGNFGYRGVQESKVVSVVWTALTDKLVAGSRWHNVLVVEVLKVFCLVL